MAKDSLEKAVGAGITLKLAGREVNIKPFTIGDYAALKKHIRDEKIAEIREFADDLGEEYKRDMVKDLIQNGVSEEELERSAQSFDGMTYLLRLQIKNNYPNISEEEIDEMLADETFVSQIMELIEALNMEEDDGNPPKSGENG